MAGKRQRRQGAGKIATRGAARPRTKARSARPSLPAAHPAEETASPESNPAFSIVGVGASAGGLEAFIRLLRSLPVDTGMAFVLVQHLAPSRESALAEILSRATSMPVTEVTDEPEVLPNRVYVIPPGTNMVLVRGHLRLLPREVRGKQHPIDLFFRSLAANQHHVAIGVVLSGTATDGTLGLEEIKAEGGITFAQDDTAQQGGMPQSAVASGCVDLVLSPEGIADEIARIAAHPYVARADAGQPDVAQQDGRTKNLDFRPILRHLRATTGVDFSEYKTSTLSRRIRRRMVLLKKKGLEDYARFVRESPGEAQALYQDILINVTSFFRDPEVFEALEAKVIPRLLAERSRHEILRVWVPACSTGEEAYSLAMILSEALDSSNGRAPVQVFATDLNGASIEHARAGVYSSARLQAVSPERLRRFFVKTNGDYRVAKPLRDMCVFSRHNVMADPPFSRMDLVSCRNLLIYLEPSIQQRIVPVLHYALKPTGFLVLGASETVGRFGDLFGVEDKKHKIFSKRPGFARVPQLPAQGARPGDPEHSAEEPWLSSRSGGEATRIAAALGSTDVHRESDRLLLAFAPPAVLVDGSFQILEFRGNTEPYVVPARGKASFSLLKMARPDLLVPLRTLLRAAKSENAQVRQAGVRVRSSHGFREVDLEVIPVKVHSAGEACFLVLFRAGASEGTPAKPAQGKRGPATRPGRVAREPAGAAVARLEQELARNREHLQALAEQYEAAIEELQSSNEEAQSANEELQSINEELSTSKEEVQSSNEELTTVNDELQNRNVELGLINSDLANLITSVHIAIVIVGRDLRIRRFSPMAEKILKIIPSDTGRSVTDVRMSLELPELEALLTEVIDTVRPSEREVRAMDGRWYSLRIRPYLTLDGKIDGAVLLLVDIDDRKQMADALHESERRFRERVDALPAAICTTDAEGRLTYFNAAAAAFSGRTPTLGTDRWCVGWKLLRPDGTPLPHEECPMAIALQEGRAMHGAEAIAVRPDGTRAWFASYPTPLRDAEGRVIGGVDMLIDITERKQAESDLRVSEIRYRRLFESAKDGILILDASTARITNANPFICELLGYSHAELLGKELWEIGLFEDSEASKCAVRELQEQGFLRYDDLPLETRTGLNIEVEFVCNAYSEDDHPVIQCNIRDITRRKQLEEDLRKRNEELAAADLAKNQFIAVLSHELRAPLNAIRGWLQILQRPGRSEEDYRKALEVIDGSSRAQAQLIDDLLDVHRIISGKVRLDLARVDLGALTRVVVDAVAPAAAEKELRIECEIDPAAAILSGDATRLQQVLGNLLGNAIKFTSRGGEVRIAVRRKDGRAELVVSDTGRGISAAALPHVFDRFRQTDAPASGQGGLGLGLAISKQLVELHGGTIEAESPGKGEGTTFTVSLPLLAGREVRTPPLATGARDESPALLGGVLVLVVDDEPDVREPVRRVLEEAGAETLVAASTDEALHAIQMQRPDVILSDLGLPGRDGYDLVRSVRALPSERGGRIPAIALTAHASPGDRARALGAGFQSHLAKPVEPGSLIAAVAALVSPSAVPARPDS